MVDSGDQVMDDVLVGLSNMSNSAIVLVEFLNTDHSFVDHVAGDSSNQVFAPSVICL